MLKKKAFISLFLLLFAVAVTTNSTLTYAQDNENKETNTNSTTPVELPKMDEAPSAPESTTPAELKSKYLNTFFKPDLIADVAQEISPSVVNIDVENVKEYRANMQPFPFGGNEFFEKFFGFSNPNMPQQPQQPQQPRTFQKKSVGNGSGVIIDSMGHILTNNHVVKEATKIKVTLSDGRKYDAKVVGKDGFSDIAVLKIEANDLKPAKLGTTNKLRPGEWAIAVGSPLGYDHTVTLGIISALSRKISNTNIYFIQTDAAINPGNSGGPLVNLNGEVIGINTAIAGIGTGIGFAIPIDVAKDVSQELIAKGFIERPWIGVAMKSIDDAIIKGLGLTKDINGVVVVQVSPDGPAAKSGLVPGDIIQRVDGKKIDSADQLQELIRQKKINTAMNIQILRDGKLQTMELTTGQWPGSLPLPDDNGSDTP